MPKANVEMSNGTKICIEGESEEVAKMIKLIQNNTSHPYKKLSNAIVAKKMKKRLGPMDHIRNLKEEGFLDSPREIMAIKHELDTKGHVYPITMLSTPLIRLVRKGELSRLKQNAQWVYSKK